MKQMNLPAVVLVRGLPGSGKSYLAKALQKSLLEQFGPDSVIMLDPDAIDYKAQDYLDFCVSLTEEGVEAKFHPYRFLRAKAHTAVSAGKFIIWNQPFTDFGGFNRTVTSLETYAKDHHIVLPILVVEVEIDHVTAKERVFNRKSQGGHGPSEDTFNRFIRDYVSFADKGYNTVTVPGKQDVTASVAAIFKALEGLSVPQ